MINQHLSKNDEQILSYPDARGECDSPESPHSLTQFSRSHPRAPRSHPGIPHSPGFLISIPEFSAPTPQVSVESPSKAVKYSLAFLLISYTFSNRFFNSSSLYPIHI